MTKVGAFRIPTNRKWRSRRLKAFRDSGRIMARHYRQERAAHPWKKPR